MIDEIIRQAILFAASFTANLFASVSGGGAGIIQFPILIFLGLPFATALGTHKVAVVFLGIGALSKKGALSAFSLDKTLSLIMCTVGCLGVVLGSVIVVSVPSHLAQIAVGIIIVGSGLYSFFKKDFGNRVIENRSFTRNLCGSILIFLIGLFSGSLSSGAGLFATLTIVGVFGLELKRAIFHTMIFVATIWNAIGAITVGALTEIHWQWVPCMILAAILGSRLGTSLLIKLPTKKIKIIFSIISILSGVLLVVAAFAN